MSTLSSIYNNVNFERLKTEEDITEQAIRLIEQVSTRNKYQALLNPMTEKELRIAKAFNIELKAHHDYCELNRQSKHSHSTLGNRMMRKERYYKATPKDGFYYVRCFVNGKQIEPPFGDHIYRQYSAEQNELLQEYCVGVCMGMFCKYKHPSVEIVWRNYGVERIVAAFNR